MKKYFLQVVFTFFAMALLAQNPKDKLGSWYMYNGNNQLSESFSIKTSAHIRYFELIKFYQQEVYRAGLTYKVSNSFNVTGGMVYSIKEDNYKGISNKVNEYRFYEDFNWKTSYKSLIIKPRIRLEHSSNSNTNFKDFNHRIRFGTTLQYPVLKKTVVYFFDEVFFNFKPEIFGENRIGAGFIQTISKPIKFQLGYMHIDFGDTYLHRFQVGFLINTDLQKKTS